MPGPIKHALLRCCGAVWILAISHNQSLGQANGIRPDEVTISRVWIEAGQGQSLDKFNPFPPVSKELAIVDWTPERLLFLDGGEIRQLQGDQVAAIEVEWQNEDAIEAENAFQKQDFRGVIQSIQSANNGKLLQWQQKILIGRLVEALWAVGTREEACRTFLALAKFKPPTMIYGIAPLAWTNDGLDRQLERSASIWIDTESTDPAEQDANRLLGASWLLTGNQREKSVAELEALRDQSTVVAIRHLAECQLWRIEPAQSARERRLAIWQSTRDKMPFALQSGPTLLIADKLARSNQIELAIAEWMRIATLHPSRYHVSQIATESAIDSLRKLGRSEDAARVESFVAKLRLDTK